MSYDKDPRKFYETPTGAVATVSTVFIVISLILIHGIEKIEHYLAKKGRQPLLLALDKMKEELMLLGFFSLMLVVFQDHIVDICGHTSVLNSWTPCPLKEKKAYAPEGEKGRRLLGMGSWPMKDWSADPLFHGRMLAAYTTTCTDPNHEPFISATAMHELHTFIFVLAIVHVFYSVFAMWLSSVRVRSWKEWEDEVRAQPVADMTNVTKQLTAQEQKTFVEHHASKHWKRNEIVVWILCFFRQFYESVTKADYLSLRLGFITKHNLGQSFNFHRYMVRSLEDEFQKVVGISLSLWFFFVLFMLFNVNGTNLYFWLSIVPAVLVLLLGTKQHHIVATLALEYAGFRHDGYLSGNFKPRDNLFWFSRPSLHLWLIHFILFNNAFEMATFLWFTWQYGYDSCLLKNKAFAFIRIGLTLAVHILCSYSTLPLYAIVVQMGSRYKKAIFNHDMQDKLHRWGKDAKKRRKGSPGTSKRDDDGEGSYSNGGHEKPVDGDNPDGEHDSSQADLRDPDLHGQHHSPEETVGPSRNLEHEELTLSAVEIARKNRQQLRITRPPTSSSLTEIPLTPVPMTPMHSKSPAPKSPFPRSTRDYQQLSFKQPRDDTRDDTNL